MFNAEEELQKQLPIEQLGLLHKQSVAAFAATIAVLLYILFWVHDFIDTTTLSIWVTAIVLLNIYLLIWIVSVNKAIKNNKLNTQNSTRYIFLYQIQSILHGGSWGVLPFLLVGITSPEMKFFAYIVLCGMAAGAIGTTAMIFRIYLSFMLPMMLPIIFFQLFFSSSFSLFSLNTLELLIIFVVSLVVLAHTHYESVLRTISLVVENKKLLADTTRSYEKAEAASEAKSRFLANMSHELRTPLNAVIGYSEIIYENAKEKDFETIHQDAEKITLAGTHLLSLINNVLDLSKIEAGKMDVYIEDINLYQLLNDIKATTSSLIEKNNNALIFNIPEKICIIKTDYTKLSQIFINIISNAAKFTSNGKIIIDAIYSPSNIKLSVTDTGIGMTNQQLDDLTIPFSQADVSTTRKYGGTGLGMNLTEHLTELLGIDVKIKSAPNKGTRFELIIPVFYIPT